MLRPGFPLLHRGRVVPVVPSAHGIPPASQSERDEFCAAGFVKDVGWVLTTIEFEKPASEVRRLKRQLEAIEDYLELKKEHHNLSYAYSTLVSDQQKRQKQIDELKKQFILPFFCLFTLKR